MFKMRWWGKGVIIKTSFTKQFKGVTVRTMCIVGGDLKGCHHPCPSHKKQPLPKRPSQ